MQYLIGFIIAVFIALTGVGAGTITTPLLILFLHVPTAVAVSTGLMFSAAVKLALVPSQVARRQVSWRVLGLMLAGGLPGVLAGALFQLAWSASDVGRSPSVPIAFSSWKRLSTLRRK